MFFDKARKPYPAAFWFNLGPSQNLSVESILQAVPCVPSVVAGCQGYGLWLDNCVCQAGETVSFSVQIEVVEAICMLEDFVFVRKLACCVAI
jgi:hypothetical protein